MNFTLISMQEMTQNGLHLCMLALEDTKMLSNCFWSNQVEILILMGQIDLEKLHS